MADPNAAIQTLLAWARQGLTTLPADPLGTNVPGSAIAQVDVRVSGAAAPIRQAVRLYGPADVAGIDPRHVIRTEPANLASNFESNFLAAIEFDRPDFPWLFTPASPNTQNKLRPWLVLVVVRQQEGVNILGGTDRPLPVLEIIPKSGFYDFNNKYPFLNPQAGGGAQHVCPAVIPAEVTGKIQDLALLACNSLGLKVYSRVDVLLAEDDQPFALEANTIPGMTEASLLPEAAGVAGISYPQLCARIIELSLAARPPKK